MKKGIIITAAAVVLTGALCAQAPEIQWQNTIGGLYSDLARESIIKTMDGGFMMCGSSNSPVGFDKTEPSWTEGYYNNSDYWIVSISPEGLKLWDKRYGGYGSDEAVDIFQTTTGDFIVSGYSGSGISGDKTEGLYGGWHDYWVMKIDHLGGIIWQKTIGGTASDYWCNLAVTDDGYIYLGGTSESPVSGNKTVANFGQTDYWVVKLDSMGSIIWQRELGGTQQEFLSDIKVTPTGGVLVVGESESLASGNKTEDRIGAFDFWVVQLDPDGEIEWQNTIGGDNYDFMEGNIVPLDDGYVLAGESISNISGDKTENDINYPDISSTDYWIVKIDLYGNVIWDRTIGGTGADYTRAACKALDGGIIIGGSSDSEISGYKSEGVGGHFGARDMWVVKLDAEGNFMWDKTIAGPASDWLSAITIDSDGGVVMLGDTESNARGDKEENRIGNQDWWVVKLFPEGSCAYPADYTSSVMATSAKLIWDDVNTATGYKVRFRQVGTDDWVVSNLAENKTHFIAQPLVCNTTYEWQVMSYCSPDGAEYSPYSALQYFTTLACKEVGLTEPAGLSIYPNPVSDKLNLSLSGIAGQCIVNIRNVSGQTLYTTVCDPIEEELIIWDATIAAPGLYIVELVLPDQTITQKCLIAR